MVFGFLLAWTPYATVAAWIFFNKGAAFSAQFMAVPAFFSKTSAIYNPVIYVLLNKQVNHISDFARISQTSHSCSSPSPLSSGYQ